MSGLAIDGEDSDGQRHDLRRRERRGDAEELRQQLTEDHREDRREQQRQGARHRLDRSGGEPEPGQRTRHERPDGRLREVADDEGRDRDADLGRRQLGRELLERLEHDPGAGVALVDGPLDRGSVEGHEGELGGDEERGAGGEQHGAEDEEPLGHRRTARPAGTWSRREVMVRPTIWSADEGRRPGPLGPAYAGTRYAVWLSWAHHGGGPRRSRRPRRREQAGARTTGVHRAHRGARSDQAVRFLHRRRPPRLRGRAGTDHRVPRPERQRQDDDPAHAARSRACHGRHGDHRRPPLRRDPQPAHRRRVRPRGDELPPGTHRTQPPARPGRCGRRAGLARRRAARARRHPRGRTPAGGRLLDGHAPAAGPRRRPPRRPSRHHPRRAGQRPRPRGHPLAARLPAPPRRRGPDPAHLQPHALRGRADGRRRRHHRQRSTGRPGHRRRAARRADGLRPHVGPGPALRRPCAPAGSP